MSETAEGAGDNTSYERLNARSSNCKPGSTAAIGRNRGHCRDVGFLSFGEVVAGAAGIGRTDVERACGGRGK